MDALAAVFAPLMKSDNRFQYTNGRIFAPNCIDASPFVDDDRQFLGQALSTSPTMASPLRDFGAVATAFPMDARQYMMPGVFTNVSSDVGSTSHDCFTVNERSCMFEVGMSRLAGRGVPIHARGRTDANNIHLTIWYQGAMQRGTQPRSYGVAFNLSQQVGDGIMWFLRAGWSEGWGADRSVSARFGGRPTRELSDPIDFAIGWIHPPSPFLDSQYTGEVFYQFDVTPNFAIAPDLQVQLHPALNSAEHTVWVFSLQARLAY